MRYCGQCGTKIDESDAFCSLCGSASEIQGGVCPSCGSDIADGAAFCEVCGSSLRGDGESLAAYLHEAPTAAAPAPQVPAAPAVPQAGGGQRKARSAPRAIWLIAAAAVLVIVVGAAAALLLLRDKPVNTLTTAPGAAGSTSGRSAAAADGATSSSSSASDSAPPPTPSAAVSRRYQASHSDAAEVVIDRRAVKSSDAEAVAKTLSLYYGGINARNWDLSWSQYSPRYRNKHGDVSAFANACRTSHDFDVRVRTVRRTSSRGLKVYVTFTSTQAPELGPTYGEGRTNWRLFYMFSRSNGRWLIDGTKPYSGSGHSPG